MKNISSLSLECQKHLIACIRKENITNIGRDSFKTGCLKQWYRECIKDHGEEEASVVSTTSMNLGLIIFIIFLAVLSVYANSIVCIVFWSYRELRTVKHYFIINLSCAELLIAAVCIPLYVIYEISGRKDELLNVCRAQLPLDVTGGAVATYTLTVISLERYVALRFSLRYAQVVTPVRAVNLIAAIWGFAIVSSLSSLFVLWTGDTPNKDSCFFFNKTYVVFIILISFIIPIIIMVVTYWKIFQVARIHARQISALVPGAGRRNNFTRDMKAAKVLTTIILTHTLCWAPLFIALLIIAFHPDPQFRISRPVQIVINSLRYCSTLANPIIYSGISRQFRHGVFKLFGQRRSTQNDSSQGYTM